MTKGDVLGVGVVVGMVVVGWAVVGVLGWVLGKRRRRRGREGWRRGGAEGLVEVGGWRAMEEGEVRGGVVGPGGELLVLKS